MKRSVPLLCILLTTACTQPAVTVEYRGQESFGKEGRGSNMMAYHSPTNTYASNTPFKHPAKVAPAAYDQPLSNATVQAAPMNSITITDLSPATTQEPAPASTLAAAEASKPAVVSNTVQPFGTTKPTPPAELAEVAPAATTTKPVELTKANESVPANPWTKKPRDAGSFATDSSASSLSAPVKDAKYIWPVTSKNVTSSYGAKVTGKANDGINISAPEGEPVWAAADGEVVYADNKLKGYGKMIIIKHNGGKTTTYAHLARYGVEKYDRVKQGDIIGYVGSTGKVKGSQLYFSMRDGSKAVDPQKYLDRSVAGL